jgi:transposase
LTIDSGQSDLKIRQEERIPALRRERIKSVTKEAFKQGTLLTAEDMAYKIFSVGYRTIIRDLDILRKGGEHIPLRSTQKDTGRTTTHKEQIVKLWLEGHEPAYISKATTTLLMQYLDICSHSKGLSPSLWREKTKRVLPSCLVSQTLLSLDIRNFSRDIKMKLFTPEYKRCRAF